MIEPFDDFLDNLSEDIWELTQVTLHPFVVYYIYLKRFTAKANGTIWYTSFTLIRDHQYQSGFEPVARILSVSFSNFTLSIVVAIITECLV